MRIRSGDQRISVDAVATQGPSRPSRGVSVIRVPETELTPNVRRALRALIREVHQLRQDNKALRSNIRYMETLADRDVFLPVLNRRAFLRDVSRALALAERHDAPSSLIYLDLNGFKHINDRYGHGAGDAVLRQVPPGAYRRSPLARAWNKSWRPLMRPCTHANGLKRPKISS